MKDGTAKGEILIKLILCVKTEQRLPLHAVERLVFKRDTHVGAGVNDALVGDGHDAHAVVYGIVAILGQHNTTRHDHYRTSRHVHGIKAYLRTI